MDIARIRAETPGIAGRLHLNNAGAALMPACVIDAVIGYTELEGQIGGYEAAAQEAGRLDAVYDDVAKLIGAERAEIAIMENATVAWDHAFYALDLKPGDRILTAEAEYAANYVAFLQRVKRDGIEIDVVPSDAEGTLDVGALETMIDARTVLIAVTWIPTNGGLVNPAAEVGRVARKHGIPYLLDACQAVGQMPVDVDELGCDFLSATGRKFLRGPRGTGFLYARKTLMEKIEPAMIDHFAAEWTSRDKYALRADARRFESWENAYALRLGFSEAIRYALDIGLDAIQDRAWMLADRLRAQLAELPNVSITDTGAKHCAIVSFSIDGVEPAPIAQALRADGINVSVSQPSSTRIDAEKRNLPYVLRASPHYYNDEAEIDRFMAALAALIG